MKLALGTAQFGLDYGISNARGQVAADEAAAILRYARAEGIRVLDTAVAYGDSEARLGELGVADLQPMTKLPPLPADCRDVGAWMEAEVAGSMRRLRVERLHCLSFHRPAQLLEADGAGLYAAARELQARGLVERLGLSIYDPDQLGPLLAAYRFEVVQAPCNVFDRRLVDSGWLAQLARLDCEVHARSVFLQGLLLLAPGARPPYFERWRALFDRWDRWLAETGLSPLQACTRHVLSLPGLAKMVVGVDGPAQLGEILDAADGAGPEPPAELASADPDLLNPSRWPKA